MNNIQLTARLKIHEGRLEEFKEIAKQALHAVSEKEPGALQYDFFFTPDESECVVRERYADSNALLAHLANVGPLLGKALEMSEFSLEVYGEPSEELRSATAALNPKIYSFYQGLSERKERLNVPIS